MGRMEDIIKKMEREENRNSESMVTGGMLEFKATPDAEAMRELRRTIESKSGRSVVVSQMAALASCYTDPDEIRRDLERSTDRDIRLIQAMAEVLGVLSSVEASRRALGDD